MKVITSLFVLPDIQIILTELQAVVDNLWYVSDSTYAQLLESNLANVRLTVAIGSATAPPISSFPVRTAQSFSPQTSSALVSPVPGHDSLPNFEEQDVASIGGAFSTSVLQNLQPQDSEWDSMMSWCLPVPHQGYDWPWDNDGDPT